MAGIFNTLEKWGFYSWLEDYYQPRRKNWWPDGLCEHCLTFWAGFIYHTGASVEGLAFGVFAGLAASSVSYLVRK